MRMAKQNLDLFKVKYPDSNILGDVVSKLTVEKVLSKSGVPTLKVLADGREAFVHSAYDPIREAKQWAEKIIPKKSDVFFVFGFGLGYETLELVKNLPDGCKIIIIEANTEFIKNALETQDLSELLQRKDTFFIIGDKGFIEIETSLLSYLGFDNLDKIRFVDYIPAMRFHDAYYDKVKEIITQTISNVIIEMNTMLRFSEEWLQNLFANLPMIIESPGITRLYGKFSSQPAIIVAAGPSLNKNISLLREAKRKSVIICVGTALKPMLQVGIKPDLVLSIDGGAANYRHFEEIDVEGIPLVFDITIYPEIPKQYTGPKLVGGCHENLLRWVEQTLTEKKGLYEMGPSVACVAFDLAKKLGCNPIILVGQDLAYTDNKAHAQGTAYDYRTINDFRDRDIFEVEGVDGHPVLTDRVLFAFLKWFETKIAASSETHDVIDATEGGAKISGTLIMSLAEAVKTFCQSEIKSEETIAKVIKSYSPPRKESLDIIVDNIKALKKQLEVLAKESEQGILFSEKLLKKYNQSLPNHHELNKILHRLNEIDKRIGALKETTELFVLLFQKSILRYKNKIKSKVHGESEIEKGKRIADSSVELYRGINQSADYARKIVESALSELENLFDSRGVG